MAAGAGARPTAGQDAGCRIESQRELSQRIQAHGSSNGLNLSGCNLDGIYLTAALALRGVLLRGASLRGATLIGVDLQGADLREADLRPREGLPTLLATADFSKAHLGGALLADADLSGAKLVEAELSGADLRRAQLSHANLTGARLGRAHLADANLWQAKLDQTRLEAASFGGPILQERNREYAPAAEVYAALRENFKKIGRSADASWAYVQERRMRREAALRDHLFAHEEGTGRLAQMRRTVARYARYAGDLFIDFVCGYGDSWAKVIRSLVLLIVLSGLAYAWTGALRGPSGETVTDLGRAWLFAFAVVARMSLDTQPSGDVGRALTGMESILSTILVGLLGFLLGRRIRSD